MKTKIAVLCILFAMGPARAWADEARVTVGDDRFATPPRASADVPRAVDDCPEPADTTPERYRAPFRASLGPIGATTGRGLGLGIGLAADFGTGTVGFRLAGAWTRSEVAGGGSPIGDGIGQYTGELTIDLHKRGPWHPILGVGAGLLHVTLPSGSADAGIGTARLAIEYALLAPPSDDADVRIGAGILLAIPGPADRELADLRGYGLLGASLAIGF
jgi:hypothetical protein